MVTGVGVLQIVKRGLTITQNSAFCFTLYNIFSTVSIKNIFLNIFSVIYLFDDKEGRLEYHY